MCVVLESSGENEKHETGVDFFIYPARPRVGRAMKWANQQAALFFLAARNLSKRDCYVLAHISVILSLKNNLREPFVDKSAPFKMV